MFSGADRAGTTLGIMKAVRVDASPGGRDLPLAGAHALWTASKTLRPGLSLAMLAGTTAVPARLRWRSGSSGQQVLPREAECAALLPLLKLSAPPEETVRMGPRLAWFADGAEGGIGRGPSGEWILSGIREDGTPVALDPAAGPRLLSELRWRRVVGDRSLALPGPQRLLVALGWWVVELRRPPMPSLTASGRIVACAGGIGACRACREEIESTGFRERGSRARVLRAAARWARVVGLGAEFLALRAGTARSAFANRLRTAGDLCADAAQELAWIAGAARSRLTRSLAADAMLQAELALGEASRLLMEALCLRWAIAPEVRRALLQPHDAPLAAAALSELTYMARSATGPFQHLAVLRLKNCPAGRAVAVLRQQLFAADGILREAGLHSLLTGGGSVAGALAAAFQAAPDGTPGLLQPFRRSLVAAAVQSGLPPDAEVFVLAREARRAAAGPAGIDSGAGLVH